MALRRNISGLLPRLDALNPNLHSQNGVSFLAGSDLVNSSDHVRGTIENPSSSTVQLYLARVIIAHDADGVLPGEIMRDPDTNLPTTAVDAMNLNLGNANTPQSAVKIDSGVSMTGAAETSFIPTSGTVPTDIELQLPIIVNPGRMVGLNLDVGGNLTSANVMIAVSWVEVSA